MPNLDHRSVIFVSCLLYAVLSGTTVVFTASRWQDMEVYLRDRSDTSFTHGVCPERAGRVQAELAAGGPIGRS